MKTYKSIIPLLGLLLYAGACSQKPAEIHYGSDECTYCKMMITDNRFASQLVTETGKAFKFDAIECMAKHAGAHKSDLASAHFWVSDFSEPGSWLRIDEATLIKSEVINSPMGASLLALGSDESADKHLSEYPGEQITWEQIVK